MAHSWRKSSDSEVEKDPSDPSEPSDALIVTDEEQIKSPLEKSAEGSEGHRLSRKVSSDKGIKKNLFADDSSDSKVEIDTSDASENKDLIKSLENLAVSTREERTDGQWLSPHPWESKKPWDFDLKMKNIVANSDSYPTNSEWTRKDGEKEMVDLAKIYLNLPTFVRREMQGSINSSRQELKQIISNLYYKKKPFCRNYLIAHRIREK